MTNPFRWNTWLGLSPLLVLMTAAPPQDPPQLVLVKHINTGVCYGLDITDTHLFTTTNTGLSILDVSNPVDPERISRTGDGRPWFCVTVDGPFAYAGGESGFAVVDISDIRQPEIIGRCSDGGTSYDIALYETFALVADDSDGLEIIDVSDPRAPKKIAEVDTGDDTMGVTCSGTVAFTADIGRGVSLIDLGDVSRPRRIGTLDSTQSSWGLTIAGERLYVGSFDGIVVFDITDPGKPLFDECQDIVHAEKCQDIVHKSIYHLTDGCF